jgi:hypothetical protein
MRSYHNLGKTHLFIGCLLSASISTTAYSVQVRLDDEHSVIDKISPPAPVVTAISEDTGTVGDGITQDNTLKIHGTASANSVVEVAINGIAMGTTVTDDIGEWLFDHTETALIEGNYTITATAIDNAGNTTNPSDTFKLVIEPAPKTTPSSEKTEHNNPTVNHKLELIVAFGGSGGGSVTSDPKGITCSSKTGGCRYTFENVGDTITLNPIAADDARFTNWGGHEDCRDGKITVAEGAQKFCMAYFVQDNPTELTLTVEKIGSGQGTVTAEGIDCGEDCRETYPEGKALTLSATATEGSQFEGWSGDCSGIDSQTTVTIAVEKNCLARFDNISPPVTSLPSVEKTEENEEMTVEETEENEEITVEETTETLEDIKDSEQKEINNDDETPEPSTNSIPESPTHDPIPESEIEASTEDNQACPPERLLNYTCNAHWQTVHDLKITDNNSAEGGLGNLSNAIVIGTIYNQGWVSNLVIKETGTVIGGVVSGSVNNQGKMIDIEFRGERINGGILAGRILNTSKVKGIIENVTLAPDTYLTGGYVGGVISGDAAQPALLENLTVTAGSVLENVLLGKDVTLPTQVTLGPSVQVIACSEDNIAACLTKTQCQEVGGDWDKQTSVCIEVTPVVIETLCSSAQLSACTTASICKEAGGQWIKNQCQSQPTVVEDEPIAVEETIKHPPHCATLTRQQACEAINGAYVAGQCKLLPTCKSQSLVLKPWGEKEASEATFACGLAVGQGQYTRVTNVFPAQPMSIRCNVKVAPTHIGQQANLVVFGCYEGIKTFFNTCVTKFCWMMDKRNGKVDVSLWDRKPESLVPYEENVVLTERISKELYSGSFQATGYLSIFVGYQLNQGDIVYSLYPIDVTIHPNWWWTM